MTKLLWQDTSILQNADLTSYAEHELGKTLQPSKCLYNTQSNG